MKYAKKVVIVISANKKGVVLVVEEDVKACEVNVDGQLLKDVSGF